MRLTRLALYRYRVPLVRSIDMGPTTLETRDGLLLSATVAQGSTHATGWGDIAPLPGFSDHSLDDALDAARRWAAACAGCPVFPDATPPDGATHFAPPRVIRTALPTMIGCAAPRLDALPGTVRFGIETAVLDAVARTVGARLPDLLAEAPRRFVSLNALVDASLDALPEAAERVRDAGFRAVKLKVGRTSVDEDVARVRRVADAMPPGVALRLDANRAWSMEQATRFATRLADVAFAYLEEPLRTPEALPEWHAATGCPFALDETAREMTAADLFDAFPTACAVVLKPALLGVVATQTWADEAATHGADVVLSSAYESGVGMRMVLALAASIGTLEVPAGLDTYRRLQHDVLAARLPIEGARVDLRGVFDPPSSVRCHRLNPVDDAVFEALS